MRIKFGVGDESADGHGMQTIEILEVTGTVNLEKDYKRGVKILGYDLTNYCNDFEERQIPKAMVEKIRALGHECKVDEDDEDEDPYLYDETYLGMYMVIAKIGNNDIDYEVVGDDLKYIHPGGYGLFSL